MPKVLAIGECMLEFSRTDVASASVNFAFGGDTLNTAVYLARQNVSTAYYTALGTDSYSEWLIREWEKENLKCDYVVLLPDALPGIYAIENTADGERHFYYWRENSAVRQLWQHEFATSELVVSLSEYDYVYFTGITLSLMSDQCREQYLIFLKQCQLAGSKIVFDPNYRVKGWASGEEARRVLALFMAHVDIALPTYEDELLLYPAQTTTEVFERYQQAGVTEVVLKLGGEGCLVLSQNTIEKVPCAALSSVIDTTGAGDSFNAGYLGGRIAGAHPVAASLAAHELAAKVIAHKGAIIPA